MAVRSGCSCNLRRLPSSRAAMTVILLAGPKPLNREKSRTSHLASRLRSLPQVASTRCISVTAVSSVLPEPMRMASSSASLKASVPFCIIFSRGRSSSAHWLIFSFSIPNLPFPDLSSLSAPAGHSSLIKVFSESLEFIFAEYATAPPGSQESRSVSDELYKGGGNGVASDAEAAIPNGGICAYQKRIKNDWQQAVWTEGRSKQEYGYSEGECGRQQMDKFQ